MTKETSKRIQAFSFLEFMQLVQEAVVEGWRFDFESNDNCPQRFGNTYEAGMLKLYADTGPSEAQIKALAELSALGQQIEQEIEQQIEQEIEQGQQETKVKSTRSKKGAT